MDKQEIIDSIEAYKKRLTDEVLEAYSDRGRDFGDERFSSWRKKLSHYFDENLPGETSRLNQKLFTLVIPMRRSLEGDDEYFWRTDGNKVYSYLDSLIIDINNDEYHPVEISDEATAEAENTDVDNSSVFIVHGHDNETKERTAHFIEKLGYNAIILHEQASGGKTIIEKIESHSNVGFAIVLYTPDDKGSVNTEAEKGQLKSRVRQNVVFEHGYLIGKIGRNKVIPLVSGNIELPNDISGMVYLTDSDWQVEVAKEMKAAGYDIDFNKIL